ncbi:hypothetical protein H4R20_000400 [Coemansia guatemalensis]|uniref:Sld7 C-terminal domain-containing protein n=1 Tax=Coemansia guatemalensis TaxID=2761395 RepID=A0A9W8LWZ2_9FUNG|nr:hypothetical protein H4R20_000400 [Coemansia guatemalensis]
MTGENADKRSRPHLVWVGTIVCPDEAVNATAALALPSTGTFPKVMPAQPLWPGGRLRLLTSVQLTTVPPVFYTSTVFDLHINTGSCDYSRRFVNGLVDMLLPPQDTAIFARVVDAQPAQTTMEDPFIERPPSRDSSPNIPINPFVLVYAVAKPETHLVLHMLDTSSERLSALAAAVGAGATVEKNPKAEERTQIGLMLSEEHEFIQRLTQQTSARHKAQVERTLSAEGMGIGSTSGSLRRTSSIARPRGNKRMTLSDIELLGADPSGKATGGSQQPAEAAAAAAPSAEVEQANKKLAKQLIISSLKERGIARDHAEFAALWSQIYRSLKFALRTKLPCHAYSVRDLRAEVEKHAKFYCSA